MAEHDDCRDLTTSPQIVAEPFRVSLLGNACKRSRRPIQKWRGAAAMTNIAAKKQPLKQRDCSSRVWCFRSRKLIPAARSAGSSESLANRASQPDWCLRAIHWSLFIEGRDGQQRNSSCLHAKRSVGGHHFVHVIAFGALKRAEIETRTRRRDAREHHVSTTIRAGWALDLNADIVGQGTSFWHDASLKKAGARHSLSPVMCLVK
jgi:hypothetical protein